MTTPTDPTTLRTALDALRYLSDAATNILNTKTADPLFPVRVVDLSRANADAQDVIIAALATPAPAADEARCGHRNISFSEVGCVDCGRLLERDTVMTDAPQVMHTTPAPAADYPGPKPFPPGCICGTDNLTDDCTAHPAPAADEARCGFVGCGGVRDDVYHEPCLPGGVFHDHKACHPFQPAPTPAPPTPPATERWVVVAHRGGDPDSCSLHGDIPRDVSPAEHVRDFHAADIDAWERVSIDGDAGWAEPTPPATEERALCRNPECRWQGQGPHWEDATPLDFGPPPPPPATEPVAALVEAFMLALVDDRYGLSRYGAHAKNVQTVAEVRARLDAIVAAARAEVDVERYIPGYRVTFAEFDRACQYLRDVGGWSGLVPFDEAIKAMAEPDADDR